MSRNDAPGAPGRHADLARMLAVFQPDPGSADPPAVQRALHLARHLQRRAVALQTPQERRQQAELERLTQSPRDKATLIQMTDQAFRTADPDRTVDQLVHILDVQGVPRFFSRVERTLLRGFQSFGSYLPGVAVPLVKDKMREETANVILPAEPELLAAHLEARHRAGVRMNVNYLGEALLGEEEAQRRLASYLAALQRPEIECISVKISTIYSQISSLAFEHTVATLCERLERLFRAAARARYRRIDGSRVAKFVYLDMEEYRDMAVTAEAFVRALERPGLEGARAGIALQAYVPDAFAVQQRLSAWARARVAAGGAPITLRIVKGANMETERLEASLRGWPQAPFQTKIETDANYKRMLHEAMQPENLRAVHVGVASHNLFDLAYGLVLAVESGQPDAVQFEMLEGMANHQRRALQELTPNLLLYAPATRQEDFVHAIGYLVRRLDENTGPDNFLRHAFKLELDSDEWRHLERDFTASFRRIEGLPSAPRRSQDRRRPPVDPDLEAPFANEPDTDFTLPQNVAWAEELVRRGHERSGAHEVPLVFAGQELLDAREVEASLDPSRPGVVVARFRLASEADVEAAIGCARDDAAGWRARSARERSALLARVAAEIRAARGALLEAAVAEGGKTLPEADPEVSEAVDFVEFYRRSAVAFEAIPGLTARPKGVVAVVTPWNFPIAIPCGGIAAALAAGNCVILKPASETVHVAYELCRCFWRGGVPREALQFLPCREVPVATRLVTHPGVDSVILTGGTETALQLLERKPDLDLLGETGGKNATIVTALSDRDLAIRHVLHSAFGHSGQKCSATSLLILEQEVYDDPDFKARLCDAVRSLSVGSAWDPRSVLGPLIHPPRGALEKALLELEPGESWAVMPRRIGDDPQRFSPGVKWGVQPGSFTHLTELFGPVLGVMKARNLDEAIALVNQTGYGLTSGLESLDDREQERWLARVRAGNLYLNRGTTGAIVLRQPFGGMGKSAFGPGIKVGGPNYLAQLMRFHRSGELRTAAEVDEPDLAELRARLERARRGEDEALARLLPVDQIDEIVRAIGSYALAWQQEFGRVHDDFRLLGQDNLRRYLPLAEVRVRLHADDTPFELFGRVCAARTAGSRVTVSAPHGFASPALDALEQLSAGWGAQVEFLEESDEELAAAVSARRTERVRYAAPDRVPTCVFRAVGDSGVYLARAPVLAEGRVELLWVLREQSISFDYHRYGNLGARAEEPRTEPA